MLRDILAREGKLSMELIENTPGVASLTTFRARFGSISRAYELVGYVGHDGYTRQGRLEEIRNIRRMRTDMMNEIVAVSEGRVSIEERGLRFRTRLRLHNSRLVAVVVSRYFRGYKGTDRWRIKCVRDECRLVILVARLDRQNNAFKDFFVAPRIGSRRHLNVTEDAACMHRAVRLTDFRKFTDAVRKISAKC